MNGHPQQASAALGHEPMLVDFDRAGVLLDVSGRTVRRLVAMGELPEPVKVRGSSRLLVEDIKAYVARLTAARGGKGRGAG